MMSHMKGGGGGAVCLRSKSHPTPGHAKILGVKNAKSVSNEEFCAAHLAYLSECAYDAYTDLAHTGKGMMLHYADLPESVPTALLRDHFRAPVDAAGTALMLESSKMYSKGRKGTPKAGEFGGDNEKKENAASEKIKTAAKRFLYPIYDKCVAAAEHDKSIHGQ